MKHVVHRLEKAIFVSAALILCLGAQAEESPKALTNASIPLADSFGIQGFRVVGRKTLLIEGINHQWYAADIVGPCFGLTSSFAIGFVTGGDGRFDRDDHIMVDGKACYLRSLSKIPKSAPMPGQ